MECPTLFYCKTHERIGGDKMKFEIIIDPGYVEDIITRLQEAMDNDAHDLSMTITGDFDKKTNKAKLKKIEICGGMHD